MILFIIYVLGILTQVDWSFSALHLPSPQNGLDPYILKTNSTYFVMAPKVLRPGRPYEVSISIADILEPVQVTTIIKHGLENVLQTSIEVTQSRPGKAKFMIPNNFSQGSYSLVVFGRIPSLDFLFLNETKLYYSSKAVSSFIQTDKPIYKAGQQVRFRVINVDPDLKPYIGAVNISIYDGKKNKIKQWLNESNENGVISQQLQLSDQPVLGNWNIKVEILGAEEETSFSVDEYVLPKFEVSVELPKYVLWKDSLLYVKVNAKYTFGKPVSGNLELQIKRTSYGAITLLRTEQMKNGSSVFPIPLRSFYPVNMNDIGDSATEITVIAILTEPLTNVTRNGSSTTEVYKNDIKLKVIKQSSIYKPGLPFIFHVIVMKVDESPLLTFKQKLNVTYILKNNKEESREIKTELYEIPESGMVKVQLPTDLNVELNEIKISYDEALTTTFLGTKAISRSNNFVRIIGSDKPVKIGSSAVFEILCTEPLRDINFVVISQERIITTGILKMKNKSQLKFSLKIIRNMAPVSRMLVYYKRIDNEVITDVLAFDVDDFFENKVTLNFQLKEGGNLNQSDYVGPGDEIFLKGSAAPNSFVGVVAVDQSVLLLKEQNEITENVIITELGNYNNIQRPYEVKKGSFGFDAEHAIDVFRIAGFAVMTNAYIYNPRNIDEESYDYQIQFGNAKYSPGVDGMNGFGSADQATTMKNDLEDELSEDNDSSLSVSSQTSRIRRLFPESWLWMDITSGENGDFSQNETVPDTITSWVASAISVDKTFGLGVTNNKANLRVFRPFFVSLNLPYSMIRGEVLQMQVLVFNYLNEDAEVSLELEKSDQFELAIVEEEKEAGYSRNLKVEVGKPSNVTFAIVPLVAGSIDIKVTARTNSAGDAEQKKLLVKPEGVTQYFSSSFLIDLREEEQTSKIVSISLPTKDIVTGSERAEVSVSGDLFGNTINYLDNLVRVPGGCGEQNLATFVPNILVLNYLKATKQLKPDLLNRVVGYLETGYQRQLTYKRSDGSFSVFGDGDNSGSTWLTAFVVKSFQQAKSYIGVDEQILIESVKWLKTQQKPDGSFNESGKIFNRDLQGGIYGSVTLAAYIITALQHVNLEKEGIEKVIFHTQYYLEDQVDSLTEPYSLALASYALTLVRSGKSNLAFEKLKALSKNEDDMTYWSQTQIREDDDLWKWNPFRTRLIDIETTSYALLTYILKEQTAQAVPIAKWLNSKRNSFGGFQSTQDTVMGLEALTSYAAEVYSSKTDINAEFKVGKRFTEKFDINANNALLHQTAVLPKVFKKLQIIATGKGTCLAQVSWQYNIALPKETDAFLLTISPLFNQASLKLKICAAHKENDITGMVVMEVSLPSGYVADSSVKDLQNMESVQRIDTEDGDTRIIVYFSEISDKEICLQFMADKNTLVDKLKDSPVSIYEYYSPEKRTTRFYKPMEENKEEEK